MEVLGSDDFPDFNWMVFKFHVQVSVVGATTWEGTLSTWLFLCWVGDIDLFRNSFHFNLY